MPRAKFLNHKGRNRKFTSPEELEEQRKLDEQKRNRKRGSDDDSSSESEEERKPKKGSDASDSSEESDSDDEPKGKAKGVQGLIEVENPNRVVKKNKKLSSLNELGEAEKPELSRREREEIERQRAAAAYQKAHAEGRTEQARADLARLAIIKQQREEAAKRREMDKKSKDEAGNKKR